MLGFSGTLMSRNRGYFNPNIATSARVADSVKANLLSLSEDPHTDVIILSSVSQNILDKALGNIPGIWLVAEGGVTYRRPNSLEWVGSAEDVDTTWIP